MHPITDRCFRLQTDQNTMIRHMEDLIKDFDNDLLAIVERKRELATRYLP